MSYSEYLPKHERPVVTALLTAILAAGTAILAAGMTITINDGEEDIVTSDKLTELQAELGGTGEDYIVTENGSFYLIYNNGSDYDPMIVITDYTSTDFCDKIWNTLNDKYGE